MFGRDLPAFELVVKIRLACRTTRLTQAKQVFYADAWARRQGARILLYFLMGQQICEMDLLSNGPADRCLGSLLILTF